MKKLFVLFASTFLCFCFCGCNLLTSSDSENLEFNENAVYDSDIIDGNNDDSFIFTYLSYMEIAVTQQRKTEREYKAYIESLFNNMKKINVTDCFLQVRPFADAMYESELFPTSGYCKSANFDPLKLIIDVAHSFDIDIHGWINPYRCGNNFTFFGYGEESNEIIKTQSGTYFNPGALSVQKLIISGVKELLENYDIKGIHIDDYFYPPDVYSADKTDFDIYKKSGGKLSLSDWRKENVNALVKGIYFAVKSYGDDKIFSISPSGDIDKNMNEIYADVELWCGENGYCDIVLPQLYFGFDNESLPFEQTLSRWLKITDRSKVKIVPVLALYKSGNEDVYAGESGKMEWIDNNDIIKRQVECLRKEKINSFALYSGSYINFSETFLSKELYSLKSVL